MFELMDREMIREGDVMAFWIGRKQAYVPCKYTVGILTVGEFKKLSQEKIIILRRVNTNNL